MADAADPADVPFWRRKSLAQMTDSEWESLCDGCGKCCLVKLEDADDSARTFFTDVGCTLLDGQSCRCTDYPNRTKKVSDCVRLTPRNINRIVWLPPTCAYRLAGRRRRPLLVASAGLRRPRDRARGRHLGARAGQGQGGGGAGRGAGGPDRELAGAVAEGEQAEGVGGSVSRQPSGRGRALAPASAARSPDAALRACPART